MTEMGDARVPVVFAAAELAGRDDALLLDAGSGDTDTGAGAAGVVVRLPAAMPGHRIGCACCVPRGAAAEALGRLFLARARGEVWFFRRVVVSVADAAVVREAVLADRLVAGRYRLDSAEAGM
jgi:hypothetical protein